MGTWLALGSPAFARVAVAQGASEALSAGTAIVYSPPVNVSDTPWFSGSPALATNAGGDVFVAWQEASLVQCAHSADGGKSFSPPVFVAPGQFWLSFGQVRLTSGGPQDVRIAFTSFNVENGGAEIVYAASHDAGQTFPDLRVVSYDDWINSYVPDIAAGWGIAVAWSNVDFYYGGNSIEVSVSVDDGDTFSEPRQIDALHASTSCPDVELSGESSVMVAWVENLDPSQSDSGSEILFVRSDDRGQTFSEPLNVSNTAGKSWCPRMAIDDAGTVYLAWVDGSFGPAMQLFFSRSQDGGASFSEARALTDIDQAALTDIAAVGDGTVWLTWTSNDETSTAHTWLARSPDAGDTFTEPSEMPSTFAEIAAISADEALAVWNEGNPYGDIFLTRATLSACGDANGDGNVTASDALLALKAATASAACDLSVCDTDESGTITASDALAILRVSVALPVTHWCNT